MPSTLMFRKCQNKVYFNAIGNFPKQFLFRFSQALKRNNTKATLSFEDKNIAKNHLHENLYLSIHFLLCHFHSIKHDIDCFSQFCFFKILFQMPYTCRPSSGAVLVALKNIMWMWEVWIYWETKNENSVIYI